MPASKDQQSATAPAAPSVTASAAPSSSGGQPGSSNREERKEAAPVNGARGGGAAPSITAKPPPTVSPELVNLFKSGDRQRNLVLKVQDTGGQPIFLSLLELLTTPGGTIYLIVFNLKKLHTSFEDTMEDVVGQLKSIQLHAAGAPTLLTGTRKDQVEGGDKEIKRLSDQLLKELKKRCAPAIDGLQFCNGSELCFFPVENKRGYSGDVTIRQLVAAIDEAARTLPSLEKRMPLEWLRVYDELRHAHQKGIRRMTYTDFQQICLSSGLPHQGFTIEQELPALLSFFHSLNFVLWYDTDALRDLVVLDPSWVIDAVTTFVRDFEMRDHTEGYERMKDLDERAKREEPKAWELLTKGSATLQRKLLDLMWSSEEFAPHKDALISLIVKFGLACPVPMKSMPNRDRPSF